MKMNERKNLFALLIDRFETSIIARKTADEFLDLGKHFRPDFAFTLPTKKVSENPFKHDYCTSLIFSPVKVASLQI